MRRRDDVHVAPWLALAAADLQMAEFVLQQAAPTQELCGLACFHAQQVGEKAVKALLAALDTPVPRTHDLMLLAGEVPPAWTPPEAILEALAAIADYGIGPRYPTPGRLTTLQDAVAATQAGRVVLGWVVEMLEASGR